MNETVANQSAKQSAHIFKVWSLNRKTKILIIAKGDEDIYGQVLSKGIYIYTFL